MLKNFGNGIFVIKGNFFGQINRPDHKERYESFKTTRNDRLWQWSSVNVTADKFHNIAILNKKLNYFIAFLNEIWKRNRTLSAASIATKLSVTAREHPTVVFPTQNPKVEYMEPQANEMLLSIQSLTKHKIKRIQFR